MRRTRTITKTVTKSVEYRLDITLDQIRQRFSVPENSRVYLVRADDLVLLNDVILTATWTVTK